MRRLHVALELGLAGILVAAGACCDPVNVREGGTPTAPPRVMDIVVHNDTGRPVELALESDHAAVELGVMDASLESRFEVDVDALGGAGVGRLVVTDGRPWVMRSDPVWLEGGRALEFTVTSAGIVWRPARG